MSFFRKSTKQSQPKRNAAPPSLKELSDRLLESIGRWSSGYQKLLSPTIFNGVIHKTSGIIEEIIRGCIRVFLAAINKDDRPGIENTARPGMGEQVRILKRLQPILAKRFPDNERLIDAPMLNLLDSLVSLRNDCMHRCLDADDRGDQEKLVKFVNSAKTLCESELVRLAISMA